MHFKFKTSKLWIPDKNSFCPFFSNFDQIMITSSPNCLKDYFRRLLSHILKKMLLNFYRTLEDIVPVSRLKDSTSAGVSAISVIAWDWKHLQAPGYILTWPTSLKTLFLKYTAKLRFFKYWGDQNHFYHSHKKRIVWKHGPNWSFYALALRTKLY